jgi:hypothetical protein
MNIEKWENPLSLHIKQYFLSRFSIENIKLSYETVAPKKVLSSEYDLCMAIPYGKKSYIWYTFYNEQTVCLLLELNRDNQINDNISIYSKIIPKDFELGTIISGTIYEEENTTKHFIIDDIHMYKGINISKKTFYFKSGFLYNFFKETKGKNISLVHLWDLNNNNSKEKEIPYNIRHIQYRATQQILPHYNVSGNKKPLWNPIIVSDDAIVNKPIPNNNKKIIINTNWKYDFFKPIYKRNVFFWVKADLAYDVYYLGALSKQSSQVIYCQNALILNLKTSILLNTIFRNIRENKCLDLVEDSDNEEDFEDVREDKFVDLEKECIMECYFHFKFKKWIPLYVVSTDEYKSRVVNIQNLI